MQDYLLVKRKTVLNKFKSKTFLTKNSDKISMPETAPEPGPESTVFATA